MFGFLFSQQNTTETYVTPKPRVRDAFDVHLSLMEKIKRTYRKRETDPKAIEKTIALCIKQIEISEQAKTAWLKEEKSLGLAGTLPAHYGYKQLAIIYEKLEQYSLAIEVAQKAKQQGWDDDWDKRIKRCDKKLKAKK